MILRFFLFEFEFELLILFIFGFWLSQSFRFVILISMSFESKRWQVIVFICVYVMDVRCVMCDMCVCVWMRVDWFFEDSKDLDKS